MELCLGYLFFLISALRNKTSQSGTQLQWFRSGQQCARHVVVSVAATTQREKG